MNQSHPSNSTDPAIRAAFDAGVKATLDELYGSDIIDADGVLSTLAAVTLDPEVVADDAFRLLIEDDDGDLVDINWFCPEHAPEGAERDPNGEALDYPVWCEYEGCMVRLPVPLTEQGREYEVELRLR